MSGDFDSQLAFLSRLLWSCVLGLATQGSVHALAQSPNLKAAVSASQRSTTLSADIILSWRTAGVTRGTSGTIQLAKPNLSRIVLHGDYPQVLLVSDGHTRYLASTYKKYEASAIDTKGMGIDSPWWGLPFRFFFTQSVNPFGGQPDRSATYEDLPTGPGEHRILQRVTVHGNSPMGAYTETLAFDAEGDLVESSVRFGEGSAAALFQAKLTNIQHQPIAADVFHFEPRQGQVTADVRESMLPLGTVAPEFTLRTPDGRTDSLRQQLRGRKGLLVNFWYYNCAPCRIEFPEFQKLYEQFAKQGFTIIAVDKGDPASVISEYRAHSGLTFPIVLGGEITRQSVFAKYKLNDTFPASYLLDGSGRIVYRSVGEDLAGLKKALHNLGFE